MLSSGIPTKEEYLKLESEPLYSELLTFSREFERVWQTDHGSARQYVSKWVKDPFLQWSRRWEYVFVAQKLSEWIREQAELVRVVDAGSGCTFFPFYFLQAHSDVEIECLDNDPTAGMALQHASATIGRGPMFHLENLECLDREDATVDAVYSVSVIEHTRNPMKVIDEINRVLKPGGIFVYTFDISFERRSPMHTRHVAKLIEHIENVFSLPANRNLISFDSLASDPGIVTTQWQHEAVTEGLPWRHPLAVWLYDMLRGRYRSQLYRPMTFYCQAIEKRPA